MPAGRASACRDPQADAVISTVIGTSLKNVHLARQGRHIRLQERGEYDNAGQGVLAVFKYAGSDLLGIDLSGAPAARLRGRPSSERST